jgi:hypothetical protein
MRRLAPVFVLVLAMCQAPESRRAAGDAGADVGNRSLNVELHGGSVMYARTPCLLPRNQCPGPLPVSGLTTAFPQPR